MGKNILITGATGFLGSYVAAELLRRGHFVYALSRQMGKEPHEKRLLGALRFWGINNSDNLLAKSLRILNGDVQFRNLGITQEDLEQLKGKDVEILHCAACTSFDASSADLTIRTNIEGTENILDLALKVDAKALHFVSTAYVAGDFNRPFGETDLNAGQGFNNLYEKTKYEAEVILREFLSKQKLPANIFRPAIIMGEQKTGKTTNFNTLYPYFKALCSVRRKLSERLEMRGEEFEKIGIRSKDGFLTLPLRISASPEAKKNIVPVDFVGKAMAAVIERGSDGINTFHLTNPDPPTLSWLNREIHPGLGIKGITLVEESDFKLKKPNSYERILNDSIKVFRPYLKKEPEFKSDATSKLLSSIGIYFPSLDKTYYLKLIEFAEKADFGAGNKSLDRSPAFIFFRSLEEKIGKSIVPNLKGLNAYFSIRLPDMDKTFSLLIEKGVLKRMSAGNDHDGNFTFVLSSNTLGELIERKLRPQSAFFERKVEIEGNLGEALALAPIFDEFFKHSDLKGKNESSLV